MRALSEDERELVAQTRQPQVKALSDGELSELTRRLRARRDRARDIAKRQRREMRGKAAPSGARPAAADLGTRLKGAHLTAALKRVHRERERRRAPGRAVGSTHA